MSEAIRRLYREARLKAPNGKGIHSERFHSCVISVKKKMRAGEMKSGTNPFAICMASIGRTGAVKKSHRR